jgi:hypothetical protein
VASGGKWYFDDAQEFPDTLQVNYEYTSGNARKLLTYEMRIWAPYSMDGEAEGAAVFGDRGYIILGNSRWRAYGPGGKLLREGTGDSHERPHVQNFIDCIKSRERPYCDLETVGHPASILCHAAVSSRSTRRRRRSSATVRPTPCAAGRSIANRGCCRRCSLIVDRAPLMNGVFARATIRRCSRIKCRT